MRADARANRERVLAAAEQVFGELGAHASTEEVARRAGVGIATVFRHFPTKRHLIEATLVRHFEEITRRAVELHAAPDAAGALRDLVATMVTTGATKVTLANLLDADGGFSPAAQQASEALRSAVGEVLSRAQAQGGARSGVTLDGLYFLIRGLSQAAATRKVPPETVRDALAVVLAGLRPE